ncbi:argininosuccinate lyase [Streptomyces sp. NBC_01754]|uniref:argininosuccinate lyase n=1 Tax=Streptomyces sp. NBC_01754 TaxID=2975930 RepID=UPI002DDB6447|nr:argininosuccinate lyase [Streptomyces sp. NBC_01754]WSC90851.1 argininosuccinate lyase [Streptomyces sp. NBC_01754]WSC96654.1 argininosuccinate lyase [Streptomyces sp. NBC_01754]
MTGISDAPDPAATDGREAGVDTGRLRTGLDPRAHRIVYDQYRPDGDDPVGGELRLISEVDRAHLVMLTERGIVDTARSGALLDTVDALRADDFAPVRDRPMPRGLYLAYEGWLVDRLGQRTGGVLHTGRSRNDLNATTVRLKVRGPYAELLDEVSALTRVLLEKGEAHQDVTMPAYTHGQPAVPISYGHYLTGTAGAVLRSLEGLLDAGREIDVNPLGAGAVGGTSVPVDPARTAELLGFTATAPNSVDAVASRDFVLRILSSAAVLGVLLARVARDLTWWTTEEFGLLRMADDLVGSSSMMPQKRNPFLLEHIQGRSTSALAGFTGAAASMSTAGYTNAIAVGTEAVRHLWPALADTTQAVTLLRLVVAGAQPNQERMRERAREGLTSATYLAERLVVDGTPFRTAHHVVGETVLTALDSGTPLSDAARAHPAVAPTAADYPADWLAPETVAGACAHGGGPGSPAQKAALTRAHTELGRLTAQSGARRARWADAADRLDNAVAKVVADR